MMLATLDYLVFAAAFVGAVYAMIATIAPAMPRIVSLLSGHGDPAWAAEPRLAVSARRRPMRERPVNPATRQSLHEAA